MATDAQSQRAQSAWSMLLTAPDVTARGLLDAIARDAWVTRRTAYTMKACLLAMRAVDDAPTGFWAVDRKRGSRLAPVTAAARGPSSPRQQRAPVPTAEEIAAMTAERILRVEAAQRMREEVAERRAAAMLIPTANRPRKVIALLPRARE